MWLYKEDYDFYMDENFSGSEIKDWGGIDNWIKIGNYPYAGILFTFPGKEFNIEENAVLCVYNYPTEKCSPDVDWVSFNRFLEQKNLYKVYKL